MSIESPSPSIPWPLLLLPALVHVGAWRFAGDGLAWIASGLLLACLVAAILLRWRRDGAIGPAPAALAALLTLTCLAGLIPGLWPCSLSCDNGAYYQQRWGISLLLPAAAAYLLLTLLLWRDRHQVEFGRVGAALLALVFGSTCYFLLLSWRLDMVCSQCLAIHGLVLLLAPVLLRNRLPIGASPVLVVLAMTGLHSFYHPGIVDDRVAPTPPKSDHGGSAFFQEGMGARDADEPRQMAMHDLADLGRCLGSLTAPAQLDVIFRFECAHCATDMGSLIDQLRPQVDGGRLRLRFIPATLGHSPASRDRARLLYAAALHGRFLPVFRRLLGSAGLDSAAANRSRLSDLADADRIVAAAEQHRAAWDAMADHDLVRARLSSGQTPRFHLFIDGRLIETRAAIGDLTAYLNSVSSRLSE